MRDSKKLRRSLIITVIAVTAALFSMTVATFAWYVYNTTARTTQVKMSAGSSVLLEISNSYDGDYASAAVMEDFQGKLNPVSTDRISAGFQRAEWFQRQELPDGQERLFASIFGAGVENVDYHKTSIFLRTNAKKMTVYLSDIGFEDLSEQHPLSTALRLGLVVKQPDAQGNNPEFIFEVNPQPDANRGDNADRLPADGQVLDSSKTDGSTVPLLALTQDNFCLYDTVTGITTLKPASMPLCTLYGGSAGQFGQPVEVEIYLWLEGCDLDCTRNLVGQSLKKLSLSFAGQKGD